jgi:hypothetical protein
MNWTTETRKMKLEIYSDKQEAVNRATGLNTELKESLKPAAFNVFSQSVVVKGPGEDQWIVMSRAKATDENIPIVRYAVPLDF